MSEIEIKCGEVFCELCGDCIYCYGDDPCYCDLDEKGEPGHHWYSLRKEDD